MSSTWSFRAVLAASMALGCQALGPTVSQRQGQEGPSPEQVRVSLGEQYPRELPGAVAPAVREELPPTRPERPRIGGDELLAVEFRDAPLGQVVQFLADRAGINILLDAEADAHVDVSFKQIKLGDALHTLLERHQRRLVEGAAGVFWIERTDGSQPAVASLHVLSSDVQAIVTNMRALVNASTIVIAEPSRNLVIVRGAESDIELCRNYLAEADRAQRQVLIEVRILEVVLGDKFELGVTHDIAGTVNGHLFGLMQNLGTTSSDFQFQFNSSDGDIDATVTALRRITGTDLISSPRVLALTGVEASIEVVKEVPYINVTSTQTASANGQGVNVVQEVQFKEAGVKLKVTPTIQDDGAVRIVIDQELSEVVDTFNQIPVLDRRFLKSTFLVLDRSTVVLGGLMQDKRTQVDRGIPGLMDIPWLGRLFRSDDDDTQKRELIVFLTPRIVDWGEAERLRGVFVREYSKRVRETGAPSHALDVRR